MSKGRKLAVLYVRTYPEGKLRTPTGHDIDRLRCNARISASWPRTDSEKITVARGPQNPESCPTRPGQNQQFALSISFVPRWPTKKKRKHTALLTTPPAGESRWNLGSHVSRMGRACSFSFPRQTQHSETLDKQNER